VAVEYERNLRGRDLARQILHLNGHQDEPRFVFFEPVWFFMIISISLSGFISILTYVALLGVIGFAVELSIWGWYWYATGRYDGYPGLKSWLSVQVRRRLMTVGRSAGVLSKPRG
jgi:hypothetical protein